MNRPGEETLIRYFRGQCNEEEAQMVEVYLAMKTDVDYVAHCLSDAFGNLEHEHDHGIDRNELDRAWLRLTYYHQQVPVKPMPVRTRWYSYAAAAILLIFCGAAYYFLTNPATATRHLAWKELRADVGQVRTFKLPDNSMVTLFAGSMLSLPENFGDTDRCIKLSGKAYFDVARNANKPFYVTTRELTTRVLATTFEVNAPDVENPENIITLHSGKVSIQKKGTEIAILKPNQQLRFQKSSGQYKILPVDAAYTLGWTRGELDYEQATLSTILHDLENWYGIRITTTNPELLNRKITISFEEITAERALGMLSQSAGFSYTRHGKDQIIIKERRTME